MGLLKHVLEFKDAQPLIHEGDVLLFKNTTFVSRFIRAFGGTPYTHVAVASWHNGTNNPAVLECIEQKEWVGGRTTLLEHQVAKHPGKIDVYRPNKYFVSNYYHPKTKQIVEVRNKFEGKKITSCMRNFTGLEYGYKRIWYIALLKLAGLRLFVNWNSVVNDEVRNDIKFQVCSTAIAHCFAKNGYDLVKNRSNEYTEPSDIARSASLDYLFTIK